MNKADFQEIVWQKGKELFRPMPWRDNTHPYYILVSELMLQQTQVDRVIPKFNAFIATFPTIENLASASLSDVLSLWSGLGYNRRAKFLHMAAGAVMADFGGIIQSSQSELIQLPGVGPNTAAAILNYGFNTATPYVETNIRTVYFHHFFHDDVSVSDKELLTLVGETLDKETPREWFWALMDYGSFLKKQGVGRNDKSAHYKKQAPLKGSLREVRGMILKALVLRPMTTNELAEATINDERFPVALEGLKKDGLVSETNEYIHLTK